MLDLLKRIKTFLKSVWDLIGFALVLFGIFWLPKDISDAPEAAAPWKRVLSMVDQNTALWAFAFVVLAYVAWMDVRPFLRAKARAHRRSVAAENAHPLKVSRSPAIRTTMFHVEGVAAHALTEDPLFRHDFAIEVTNKTKKTIRNACLQWSYGGSTYRLMTEGWASFERDIRPNETVRWNIAFAIVAGGNAAGWPASAWVPQETVDKLEKWGSQKAVQFIRGPNSFFLCVPPYNNLSPKLECTLVADDVPAIVFYIQPASSESFGSVIKLDGIK